MENNMNTIMQQKPRLRAKVRCVLLCAIAALLFGSTAHAQIANGDFELNCGGITTGAFQAPSACITGPWFVSHGTPDIGNVGGNATAAAFMWTTTTNSVLEGEGLFIECPDFEEELSYTLTFRYYASTNLDDIFISLTSGLVHNTSLNSWAFPVVVEQVVHHIQNPANMTWTTVTFTFTPDTSYSQLWIYPTEGGVFTENMYIDDVVLTRECQQNIVYNNFAGTPTFTQAGTSIQASGNNTVGNGQTVTFRAGHYIRLQNSFHADPGSGFFHAFIAPCTDMQLCEDNGVSAKRGGGVHGLNTSLRTSVDNYPNPFTGRTTISYTLAEAGPVTLVISNILGVQVAEIVRSGHHGAGQYSMEFDGSALPPGVYFLTLQSGTTSTTKKMVITP
jgi:hypothetical protein